MKNVVSPALRRQMFSTVKEAEDHAASMVATGWLVFANRVIARGDRPARLSTNSYAMVRDEVDRGIYDGRRGRMNISRIQDNAVAIAKAKLRAGEFPAVLEVFHGEKKVEIAPLTD